MLWLVRGDIDGFFGLALDNLVQLLVIVGLCGGVLGFPGELLYGHILPGVAVSLLVGNGFYAWQAKQLAAATGRRDVCALPYGINTVSLFAYVFLVMLPAKLAAQAAGAADPARVAWQAGLLACFGSGLIEFGGAFIAERLRKATPRAALLSTLAGIALSFIALGFLFRAYAHPLVGLTTLGVILLTYFGRVRFKGGLPGGLVAVVLGTLLAWLSGVAPVGAAPAAAGWHWPIPVLGDLLASMRADLLLAYLSVIIPMGLFNLLGSLQNIESAEAAGDLYPTTPSLAVNGLGTLAACLFGSCFPTTIYIGHPGWKALGARAGYSVLNGLFITFICLTGTLSYIAWAVPVDAGMAIMLWIGIVMAAQAFSATPVAHGPAVVMGLLPGIAAWGALMAKSGLRAAGYGAPGGPAFTEALLAPFNQADIWIHGAFALEQGAIFTSTILAAITVAVIERRFIQAAVWSGIAAGLSALGLMHSYRWTPGDTALSLTAAWPWVQAYAAMSLVFLAARWVTVEDDEAGGI
ncbi:MAG: NCS2 family permease [Methylococcaceae bacterium]|nr:MAG: NCS2 family permease [Methylococcaceae bacterium]